MELLKEFLKRNRTKKLNIHVLGDAMIDEYYDVKINRISPEYPTPIMTSTCTTPVSCPGGAANVAYQFKHFNVDPLLISWCDKRAKKVFDDHNIQRLKTIPYRYCVLPVKRRFMDDSVQVIRHDIDVPVCGVEDDVLEVSTTHIKNKVQELAEPDIAVFSDYNKGFFASDKFSLSALYPNVTTIVDPKCGSLDKWKGCTIFKPNAKEAGELTGKTNWEDQAKYLQDVLECETVVITFGPDQVSGIHKGSLFTVRPGHTTNVESVVGAGDCFAAFFAMAVGHGFEVTEAAEIAWYGGSTYVRHKRNRPIVPAELCIEL